MAQLRKPTALHVLTGTQKQNPSRMNAREYEPKGEEFPKEPPAKFTAEEKAMWREFVEAAPPGVLQYQDRFIVEQLSIAFLEFRKKKAATKPHTMNAIRMCLGLLGMTPADRSRIIVGKGKGGNKFSE